MKRVEDEAKARMRPGTDVGGWGGEMVPLGTAAPGGRRRKRGY